MGQIESKANAGKAGAKARGTSVAAAGKANAGKAAKKS